MGMRSFGPGFRAVVVGASGGIGGAMAAALHDDPACAGVAGFSRSGRGPEGVTVRPLDITDEPAIAAAADATGEVDLVIVATGLLHDGDLQPEKDLRALDAARLARSFAVNATGPALIAKHFLRRMPRRGRSVFACLSARVGSIGDNTVGGWYGYRASKAALNQIVRTASAELRRSRKLAVCVALHPGHVESRLSAPFGSGGQPTLAPAEAASALLDVLDGLAPADTGGFFDHDGNAIPW